jgi:hypothetical protein
LSTGLKPRSSQSQSLTGITGVSCWHPAKKTIFKRYLNKKKKSYVQPCATQ